MDDFLDLDDPRLTSRLGTVLRDWRRGHGDTRRDAAHRCDGAFTAADLRLVERGRAHLSPDDLPHIERAYAVTLPTLLPLRDALRVDVAAGELAAAGIVMGFLPHDATSMLVSYLELIKTLRGERDAKRLAIRSADVQALATASALDAEDVLERLAAMMGTPDQQRLAALAAFAAGAAVVVLGIGAATTTLGGGDEAARIGHTVTARGDTDDADGGGLGRVPGDDLAG